MIDRLLSGIAPHPCFGCGILGPPLCDNCKYDINDEEFLQCIACGGGAAQTGICGKCQVSYSRAWCVGERSGVLQRVIGSYKFQNTYSAYMPLAELLLDCLDDLPPDTVVVPVPTVAAHIRERGYDHTLLIARYIAKKRNLKLKTLVHRATNTKQRDADRSKRIAQAKAAFRVQGEISSTLPYLLVDDVVTTGATMQYAAKTLRDAGATTIWVAAIARQPLDESSVIC